MRPMTVLHRRARVGPDLITLRPRTGPGKIVPAFSSSTRFLMNELQKVATERAPAAIGPYSQAVVADGWIYTSGQIALDPESGTMDGGDIEHQTRRVLQNLDAVLAAAGGHASTVVRTTVYLTDLQGFSVVNDVYGEYFGEHRPARSTVEVSALPAGAMIEIDAVARVSD
jgi:2-iminobutanoate/2-iminopropanoate deaminase